MTLRIDFSTGDADGDIGHEHAVHHVHMDVIGVGNAVNSLSKLAKSAERIDGAILIMEMTSFQISADGPDVADRPGGRGGGGSIGWCKRP